MAVRALLVDDSPFDRELARYALRDLSTSLGPVEVLCAEDWDEGLRHLGAGALDLILLDFRLPGANGLDILRQLRERPHPPVIMITGQDDIAIAVETIRAGAYDYVPKSADWGPSLRLAVERVLTRVRLERELAAFRAQLVTHAAELEEEVVARTAIVQAQAKEIETLYLKAEEAARIKAEIVSNISHELRTPLHTVFGYMELLRGLQGSDDATEGLEILDKLRSQIERLHALVESLLVLNRVSSGNEGVTLSRFSLAGLIEELRAEAMVLNAEKGLALRCQAPPEPCEVRSDRDKLRAIAYHLLSNAIKFTPAGRVEVTLARAPAGGIVLRVVDTGIGVPPEARVMVFEDFRQLDGSTTRHYEGMGLGLGIVKYYTALLRGEVRLTSTPGEGTTVVVELPDATRIDARDAPAVRGKVTERPRVPAGPRDQAGQRSGTNLGRGGRPQR